MSGTNTPSSICSVYWRWILLAAMSVYPRKWVGLVPLKSHRERQRGPAVPEGNALQHSRRSAGNNPQEKRAAFHHWCLPSALDGFSKRSGWSRIRLNPEASLAHQGSDTLSPSALTLGALSDAHAGTPAPWLGCTPGLSNLCRDRDVQVPSLSPTPTKAGMKQDPAATRRREL